MILEAARPVGQDSTKGRPPKVGSHAGQWRGNLGKLQIDKEAFQQLQRLKRVAVAEEMFGALQLSRPLSRRPPAVRPLKFSPAAAAQ